MSESKVVQIFDNFCKKITEIYSDETDITEIVSAASNLSDDDKLVLTKNFYKQFTLVPNSTELLTNKKTKLFSSKEEESHTLSLSLFGKDLPLKKVFNQLEGSSKDYLWISLSLLIECLKPKKTKNDILNMEVDENVNGMISDIVSEFKNSMDSSSSNPMDAILGVTSKITEKYSDKLQSGEIKLDSLLDDLQGKMPGVKQMMDKLMPKGGKPKEQKEKVIIDENFSTDNVVLGDDKPEENNMDISKMLPMLGGLGGLESMGKDLLGEEFGDMFKLMSNPDELKNSDPEKLKQMKDKMDKMMKDKFNIDINNIKDNLPQDNSQNL